MKNIIYVLTVAFFSFPLPAQTLNCKYDQTENGKITSLDVHVNMDENQVKMSKLIPYSIRTYIYDDVVIHCNETQFLFVSAKNANEHFEMALRPFGKSTLNFIKSIHGPYSANVTCEPFEIALICN